MKVKAKEGVKVPFEHRANQYIEQDVVEVDDSAYYQRRIAEGDLILISVRANKKEKKEKVND